jgi:hypothetical protein
VLVHTLSAERAICGFALVDRQKAGRRCRQRRRPLADGAHGGGRVGSGGLQSINQSTNHFHFQTRALLVTATAARVRLRGTAGVAGGWSAREGEREMMGGEKSEQRRRTSRSFWSTASEGDIGGHDS